MLKKMKLLGQAVQVVQTEPPGHEHARYTVLNMNYECFEYKSILETKLRRPLECEESGGFLLQVIEAEGFCIAVFSWGAVSLPDDEELAARLRKLIGRKIGIFRLDGYHVRELECDHAG